MFNDMTHIEFRFLYDNPDPYLICTICGDELCTAEQGDSVGLIASVATDHLNDRHQRAQLGRV